MFTEGLKESSLIALSVAGNEISDTAAVALAAAADVAARMKTLDLRDNGVYEARQTLRRLRCA